jgi:tetratricopeptide (TPR) repeat protein
MQKNIWKTSVAGLILIIAAVLLAYIPAMRAGFVWDDDAYVTDNPLLVDSDGLFRIWFTQDSPSQYFPMVFTSFQLEHKIWGLNPAGYHVTNIILHIINVILLWLLLRRLSIPAAWLAAAVFALHPVNVESVAWITERKNVLMALFSLSSLLVWLRFVNLSNESKKAWPSYILSLLLYAFALFSKTTACTMPAALLLVLWLKRTRIDAKRWLQITPYIVLGVAMGALTVWWEQHHQGTEQLELGMNAPVRILIACRAVWFYLAKLVWPADLTFSYPKWEINPADPLQYIWVLACVVVAVCLWYWRKLLGRGTIAAVLFYIATLFPMLGIFMLYTFRYTYVADHYQYLASIGPITLAAAGGRFLTQHRYKGIKAFAVVFAASVLATLGFLTWNQCRSYKDSQTLWQDTLRKNPRSFMAYNNLGSILHSHGDPNRAISYFNRSIELCPENAEAYYNLGCAFVSQGDFNRAISFFNQAIKICPYYINAYNNLAFTLAAHPDPAVRQPNRAIYFANHAIQLQRHVDPAILDTLAVAYASTGQFEKAIATTEKAIQMAVDYKKPKLADELRSRLNLYRKGKPYLLSANK